MGIFALIFAVVILSLFWGGFVCMLLYSLRLKSRQEDRDGDEQQEQ